MFLVNLENRLNRYFDHKTLNNNLKNPKFFLGCYESVLNFVCARISAHPQLQI